VIAVSPLTKVGRALSMAFAMFCEILWALCLGFLLHRLHADPPRLKPGSSVAH